MFGSLADMEELIAEAGKRNIKIIMDMVLNHSSDEHRWFVEAKKGKDNPYHDYYVWRDGKEGVPPNDMTSAFGGSAWEWVPQLGQYYLHQFSVSSLTLTGITRSSEKNCMICTLVDGQGRWRLPF